MPADTSGQPTSPQAEPKYYCQMMTIPLPVLEAIGQPMTHLKREGLVFTHSHALLVGYVGMMVRWDGVGCWASNKYLAAKLDLSEKRVEQLIRDCKAMKFIVDKGVHDVTYNGAAYRRRVLETPWNRAHTLTEVTAEMSINGAAHRRLGDDSTQPLTDEGSPNQLGLPQPVRDTSPNQLGLPQPVRGGRPQPVRDNVLREEINTKKDTVPNPQSGLRDGVVEVQKPLPTEPAPERAQHPIPRWHRVPDGPLPPLPRHFGAKPLPPRVKSPVPSTPSDPTGAPLATSKPPVKGSTSPDNGLRRGQSGLFPSEPRSGQEGAKTGEIGNAVKWAQALRDAVTKNTANAAPWKRSAWAAEFDKLRKQLVGDNPDARIEEVLTWYAANMTGPYAIQAHSGASFREKFDKLEAAMRRARTSVKAGKLTPTGGGEEGLSLHPYLPDVIAILKDSNVTFPGGGDADVERVASASLYNRARYLERLDASDPRDEGLVQYRDGVRRYGEPVDFFVGIYLKKLAERLAEWDGFDGDITRYVWHPREKHCWLQIRKDFQKHNSYAMSQAAAVELFEIVDF